MDLKYYNLYLINKELLKNIYLMNYNKYQNLIIYNEKLKLKL